MNVILVETYQPFQRPHSSLLKSDNGTVELDIHIIADNYATHKHPAVTRWLDRHARFHMHSGFVRDRHGNPVEQTTASIEQLVESGTCFAGTPDDVYDQIKALSDSVGGFGNLLMFGQGGFLDHKDTGGTPPAGLRPVY